MLPSNSRHDWRKFLLICGKAGTGQTSAVLHSIRKALKAKYRYFAKRLQACKTPTVQS